MGPDDEETSHDGKSHQPSPFAFLLLILTPPLQITSTPDPGGVFTTQTQTFSFRFHDGHLGTISTVYKHVFLHYLRRIWGFTLMDDPI